VTRTHDPIRNYSLLTFAALIIGDHFSMIEQSNHPDPAEPDRKSVTVAVPPSVRETNNGSD
jgi:hypothetical protein